MILGQQGERSTHPPTSMKVFLQLSACFIYMLLLFPLNWADWSDGGPAATTTRLLKSLCPNSAKILKTFCSFDTFMKPAHSQSSQMTKSEPLLGGDAETPEGRRRNKWEDLRGIVSFFPHQSSLRGRIQEVSGDSVPGKDTNTQRTAAEKTERDHSGCRDMEKTLCAFMMQFLFCFYFLQQHE